MPNTPNQRSTRSNSGANASITLSDIKTLIETSKQEVMNKFEEIIIKQTQELTRLSKRIEDLVKSNFQLENKCKALEEKVTNLPSTIFEEVEDRHHRRKNLVFTGIPEQTDGSASVRKELDTACVKEILKDLSLNNVELV